MESFGVPLNLFLIGIETNGRDKLLR